MTTAVFFLGRGSDARPLGWLESRCDSPDRRGCDPTPHTLNALPVARCLFTAADPDDYAASVTDLLTAWSTGGFGTATATTPEATSRLRCPRPHLDGPLPYGMTRRGLPMPMVYAFDEDRVWWWHNQTWHTITVTTPGRPLMGDPTAPDPLPVLTVTPVDREYGASYTDTAGLDLPQLAVWLMAELTGRGSDGVSGFPAHARYAAAVNPTRREVALWVFGLDDEEIDEYDDAPTSRVFTHYARPIVQAHNYTNPRDPDDRRFTFLGVSACDQAGQHALRERGRGPGTVTVIDTDPALAGWDAWLG